MMGAGVAALMVWAGIEAYRVYDYVQHDNEFCLSCHLMKDPYERFARSAHSELGCKSCHRPTLAERSSMALTQIVENPDSLGVHAEVPSSVCIECHVDGDPETWSNVAASAGHRVHLESDDPELAKLECVKCHSSSVHEFTATDQTCGQAGCHESQDIRLGAMGALTIHCATCHEFSAVVSAESSDSVHFALLPQREICMSCHAMRERLAGFPLEADDPHGGMCAACHNPHEQAEPNEAFQTCTSCHAQADTLTPYHRGLDAGVLETCSRCHAAHIFHIEGVNCQACHTDPARPEIVAPSASPHAPRTSLIRSAGRLLASVFLPTPAMAQQTLVFEHARHTQVECTACHSVDSTHGRVSISGAEQCFACHHSEATAQQCLQCHTEPAGADRAFDVRRMFTPSVGRAENRTFPFDHARHTAAECAECHRTGQQLSAAAVDCTACHEQHHDADNNCIGCHETPAATAHTRTDHLTCAGSGCHSPAPVSAAERTRNMCLACHPTLIDHRPGGTCVDCHTLPAATQASVRSRGQAARAMAGG
jgi:nitrate/TMAO reductase-like tetraheme cytochrome c subunit